MDQQNKAKPEENQSKPAELSDKDLEQVSGGLITETGMPANNGQHTVIGTAREKVEHAVQTEELPPRKVSRE